MPSRRSKSRSVLSLRKKILIFRQILINLIGNAVKFTNEGHVKINVKPIATGNAAVARLEISVEDTGIGIPEEKLSKLFQRFYQVDPSITRIYGGKNSMRKKFIGRNWTWIGNYEITCGTHGRYYFCAKPSRKR